MDKGSISVQANKCLNCGLEMWALFNSDTRKTYNKIVSEFSYDEGIKHTV